MRTLSADWVIPVEGPPIRDGAVVVGGDGRIAAVGPAADLGAGRRFEESVIAPGFVNAHAHLEYSAYAGFGDGLPFGPWIALHVERKRRLELADMLDLARFGAASCLRSGITTVGDLSFSGSAAQACAEAGLRATVYLEVFGEAADGMARFAELHARLPEELPERVRIGISPHAPYTCTIDLYAACAETGLPLATHLAESEAERLWVTSGSGPWRAYADLLVQPIGRTGARALAEAGLLGPTLSTAHCVHVDEEEIALLAEHGVPVAHCPRSNALLGCGIAPLASLRSAGVPVCVATDSPASTPSFDIFEELRVAIMVARAREQRPEALAAADALELATLGGARALGLAGEIGSLTPGKWADLVVLSLSGSQFVPWEDPVNTVVLGGSPDRVAATLVAGEIRYERERTEETARWRALTRAAQRARSRMLL